MLITVEYDAMFFGNGNVRKEFAGDEHYVGHTLNPLASSSLMVVDYHEGWMVLIHAQDEELPKPIYLARALLSPNFIPTNPDFCQIEVEY